MPRGKPIHFGSQHHAGRARVPRHIRRLMVQSVQCNYTREEYLTSADRNARYSQLRALRAPGLVKYSDINSIGLSVYVVAWTGKGMDMTPANRETGGATQSPALKNPENSGNQNFTGSDVDSELTETVLD